MGLHYLPEKFDENIRIKATSDRHVAHISLTADSCDHVDPKTCTGGAGNGSAALSTPGCAAMVIGTQARFVNEIDKVFGAAVCQQANLHSSCITTTSRCCVELVQKTIRLGIPSLATLLPPSSMAVKTARRHNLNLVYLREGEYPQLYLSEFKMPDLTAGNYR